MPESRLTGRLLHDGLTALFGVAPWDSLITPGYRFFRMRGGAATAAPAAAANEEAAEPRRRAWWRLGLR